MSSSQSPGHALKDHMSADQPAEAIALCQELAAGGTTHLSAGRVPALREEYAGHCCSHTDAHPSVTTPPVAVVRDPAVVENGPSPITAARQSSLRTGMAGEAVLCGHRGQPIGGPSGTSAN